MNKASTDSRLVVACCVDRNYLDLAAVLLQSLEQVGNLPEAEFVVCEFGLTAQDKSKLEQCVNRRLQFVRLNEQQNRLLSELPVRRQITSVTYARLFLPDILGQYSGRLLYLDSDIVINGSLQPLVHIDLKSRALAAVHDGPAKFVSWRNRVLGRDEIAAYFNGGVLLIDLEAWRNRQFGARAVNFALLNAEILDWVDQDALNVTADGEWCELDRRWNWCTEREGLADYTSARVIHFTSKLKPNHLNCDHSAKSLYLRHRLNTPWRDVPLKQCEPNDLSSTAMGTRPFDIIIQSLLNIRHRLAAAASGWRKRKR